MSFGGYDLMGLIGLIVLALVIILLIKFFLILVPAIIVSILVYWVTGSTWWTGLAFLVITALSILKKL